jgi:hypothetical protein
MSEMELVEAVKSGNRDSIKELIESGTEVNRQDKQGWTALNWAAAKGNLDVVELLLQHGADPFEVGRDLRTPAMIALAAGQAEVVRVLRQKEAQLKGQDAGQSERKYYAAYHLGDLRRYPAWAENKLNGHAASNNGQAGEGEQAESQGLSDNDVVFLHQDYKVTKSIWSDEDVIFSDVTEQWKDFCKTELRFAVPDELDLIGQPAEATPSAS